MHSKRRESSVHFDQRVSRLEADAWQGVLVAPRHVARDRRQGLQAAHVRRRILDVRRHLPQGSRWARALHGEQAASERQHPRTRRPTEQRPPRARSGAVHLGNLRRSYNQPRASPYTHTRIVDRRICKASSVRPFASLHLETLGCRLR